MEAFDDLVRVTLAQLQGHSLSEDEQRLVDESRRRTREEYSATRARQMALVADAPKAWRSMRTAARDALVLRLVRAARMSHDEDAALVAAGRIEPTKARVAAARFVASPDPRYRFLLICGGVGTGKTLAALAAAFDGVRADAELWACGVDSWEAPDWGRHPHMVERASSADELVRSMLPSAPLTASVGAWKASQLPQLWQPWADERAEGREPADRSVRVLVLDDLGCELDSARWHAAFGELVDERQGGAFKTILTTNLKPTEIRPRYGDRIADRLNHLGRMVIAEGPTRRRRGAL